MAVKKPSKPKPSPKVGKPDGMDKPVKVGKSKRKGCCK